jgi:hypothetical protein
MADHDDEGHLDPLEDDEEQPIGIVPEKPAIPGADRPIGLEDRNQLADRVLAMLFSLRPDDQEPGQAWCMDQACNAVARAILAASGMEKHPEELIETAIAEIRDKINHYRRAWKQQQLARHVRH